jgi:pimeloyl-ACP methyl ester carboxylesterase
MHITDKCLIFNIITLIRLRPHRGAQAELDGEVYQARDQRAQPQLKFWRSMLTTPLRRSLVPVTAFSEFGIAAGEDGKKPLHWFDVPSRVMRQHPTQVLRSSYVGFFQLNGVAEVLLRARSFALLKRMMVGTALPTTFTSDELAAYVEEWQRPGRLSAMLNYYRALVRRRRGRLGSVETPTKILWGMKDTALGFALAEASLDRCREGSLIPFPAASHWLQHDEPEAAAAALIAFHSAI